MLLLKQERLLKYFLYLFVYGNVYGNVYGIHRSSRFDLFIFWSLNIVVEFSVSLMYPCSPV